MRSSRLRYTYVNTINTRRELSLGSGRMWAKFGRFVQDHGIILIGKAENILPLLCIGLLFMWKTDVSSIWCITSVHRLLSAFLVVSNKRVYKDMKRLTEIKCELPNWWDWFCQKMKLFCFDLGFFWSKWLIKISVCHCTLHAWNKNYTTCPLHLHPKSLEELSWLPQHIWPLHKL